MKANLHPDYNEKIKISCACGNSIEVGSTSSDIQVEICSACHPFYTGKQKLVDTARRVDKFKKRMEQKEAVAKTRVGKKAKKERAAAKKEEKNKEEAKEQAK